MFANDYGDSYNKSQNKKKKLAVNQELFKELMEAGSYFLHLNEFVACMANAENAKSEDSQPVGKILQAFSLAISDFLSFYQSQIIDFPNKVQTRRKFEDSLVFQRKSESQEENLQLMIGDKNQDAPTLLDLLTHLSPLLG